MWCIPRRTGGSCLNCLGFSLLTQSRETRRWTSDNWRPPIFFNKLSVLIIKGYYNLPQETATLQWLVLKVHFCEWLATRSTHSPQNTCATRWLCRLSRALDSPSREEKYQHCIVLQSSTKCLPSVNVLLLSCNFTNTITYLLWAWRTWWQWP